MANTKVPVELFDSGAGFAIGSGAEEDIKIIFDGNAVDYHIGLRDSGDKFIVGKGQTLGTDQVFEISDGISSKPQVGVGYAGANPMSLSYTGTAFAVSEQTGTASVQIDGGNSARMDFGVGGTALFRMYTDTSNYTEFKRTTNHPIIFNTNNTEIARFVSTEFKLASGKKLVGGGTNVDFTIQSEHRTEIIGASKGTIIFKDQGTAYGLFERPTGTNDFDIQNPISDGDIKFIGNDGGSLVTPLRFDMSTGGRAIFNSDLVALDTVGQYLQVAGSSSTFWAIGSTGGNNPPGTASTTLAFHHYDGSNWNNEVEFDSSGNIVADGNITAFSDVRLKDNIETIENGLAKVNELRGVSYSKDNKKSIGVIAQEVEKVLPEIVITGKTEEKLKSVDYGRLTAVLIEAVKELEARVKELESK